MFRVEILKAWHRLRTWLLAAALAAVALLPVLVLATTSGSNAGGPPFFEFLEHNGLFAGLTGLVLIQPFFLPLGAGLLSGESIAWEASNGTLRYLLVRPVPRARLVLSKFGSVIFQLGVAVLWVMAVGLVAGAVAFGFGPLPTLSGTTLSVGAGLVRIVLAGAYILAGVTGLAALGTFISTLTTSATGATVATVMIGVVSQILDSLTSLHAIHPYLLSHGWLAYADLFRSPVAWDGIIDGIVRFAIYTLAFLGLALWSFGRKDVTA